MNDFGLIGQFNRLALAEILFAAILEAMPVFWRFFRPDLIGQHFVNALWMAPRLGSSQPR